MKFRSFVSALAGVVVALLVVAAAGAVWLATQSPLRSLLANGQTAPQAAIFVSKQTPLMTSLLVNPDQLQAFRLAVAPPGKRRQARAELEQIKQNLLTSRGLSYPEDVQPWLGDEITWAVTSADVDRDSSNGQQPGYLLAIATQNPERSREFLQLYWQKQAVAGTSLEFEQYGGIKIISAGSTGKGGTTLSSAAVGDRFLLFANSPKVIREAINNAQAKGLNLNDSPSYQTALDRLPDQRAGITYINIPQLQQWLNTAEPATDGQFESLVLGVSLKPGGLLADTVLLAAPGQSLPPTRPALDTPSGALQFLPASSPFSASGVNLHQLWFQLSAGLSDFGTLSALLNQPIAALEKQWNVSFSDDLVSWVEQEFALGLVPRPGSRQGEWVFVAEKSAATAEGLAKLDAIAQKQGLSIGPVTLNNQPAFAWTRLATVPSRQKGLTALQADIRGIHTSAGNYEVFATSAEALELALNAAKHPLTKAPTFAGAIAPLSSENDGYLYIDWRSVKGTLEQRLPLLKLVEFSAKPLFDHLQSLTITSYGGDAAVKQGAVFVKLQDD
jgi:hypothetical protein